MRDIARLDDYRPDHSPVADGEQAPDAEVRPAAPRRGPGERPGVAEPTTGSRTTAVPEPLWREALGERLRAHRTANGSTLTRTAERAGVSPQYLSEMERGLKEPSSEMIAAVAGALGLTLTDLVGDVARHLAPSSRRSTPATPQLLAA